MPIKKNDINEVVHNIKIKLYDNKLKSGGKYYARTAAEKSLDIKHICDSLITRGGFDGNYDILLGNARQLLEEIGFLLADGYSVNLKYFSITPKIRGNFDKERDNFDPEKNRLNYTYRTLAPLRRISEYITIENMGLADCSAYIDGYTDDEENISNEGYIPGNMFTITGSKVKIAGDNPEIGIYFEPVEEPDKIVKVTRTAVNNQSKLTGIAPSTGFLKNRLVIKTQYSSSTTLLKKPRVIKSNFELEEL